MSTEIVRTKIETEDLDIVLCESLIDQNDDFYDLTFGMALDEQLRGSPLLWCKYVVQFSEWGERLQEFLGYTNDRVIFHVRGIGVPDTLLDSVPRNPPPTEDRFTI